MGFLSYCQPNPLQYFRVDEYDRNCVADYIRIDRILRRRRRVNIRFCWSPCMLLRARYFSVRVNMPLMCSRNISWHRRYSEHCRNLLSVCFGHFQCGRSRILYPGMPRRYHSVWNGVCGGFSLVAGVLCRLRPKCVDFNMRRLWSWFRQ